MPKKKEADTPTVDEKFDALDLTTKEPKTVVLMLNSSENLVIAKACESLHKYAEKSERNRLELLNLSAVDPLLQHLRSTDKAIRAHAALCISSLSTHSDVRKLLRKLNSIPVLISLLNADESSISQEKASLTLSNMAGDFTSKIAIIESNGVSSLITLLSSPDCDIQRNCVKTLSLLMEDYQGRAAIRECDGLSSLVSLLDSEYPVVQELALLTLTHCSQDGESRECLRDIGALQKIVEFLQNKSYGDLHVHALQMLSNSLEDVTSTQLLQGSGALTSLLQFTQEATSSDVQRHAVSSLGRAARNPENRRILHEQDMETTLTGLLNSDNCTVAVAAAVAITSMAESPVCRDTIAKEEGISGLVKLLAREESEAKEAALLALSACTASAAANCRLVVDHGGLEHLIESLSHEKMSIQANAATCIANLATDESCRADIQQVDTSVALLLKMLESSGLDVLKELCESTSRRSQFTQLALDCLLDNCISAKYWLTGQLSPTDIIQDGFYDVGLCRAGAKFLTLEDLCKQAVDQSRAILLINAGSDKPTAAASNLETDQSSDVKHTETANLPKERSQSRTRGGRGKKAAKSEKDLEPQGRSDEPLPSQRVDEIPSWQPPLDQHFRSYVDHIRQRLLPLATVQEQVEYLATFVSNQMGGEIEQSAVTSFSYEHSIGKIKYELKSNVVPIGRVSTGIFYHRALLFKALADRVAISCSLVRGGYNRAWNVVLVPKRPRNVDGQTVQFPSQKFVVDLMYRPGCLMAEDSQEAIRYQHV